MGGLVGAGREVVVKVEGGGGGGGGWDVMDRRGKKLIGEGWLVQYRDE